MSDDLRWSWRHNNRNKLHNKCNVLESSWNHFPPPLVHEKNCLPWNWSLVSEGLGTAGLGHKGRRQDPLKRPFHQKVSTWCEHTCNTFLTFANFPLKQRCRRSHVETIVRAGAGSWDLLTLLCFLYIYSASYFLLLAGDVNAVFLCYSVWANVWLFIPYYLSL